MCTPSLAQSADLSDAPGEVVNVDGVAWRDGARVCRGRDPEKPEAHSGSCERDSELANDLHEWMSLAEALSRGRHIGALSLV